MQLTLGMAAKQSGFSKATLSRAIKNGALSASKWDDGSYRIDPAELQRWVDNNPHPNSKVSHLSTPAETPETPINDSALQAEVEKLKELLARADISFKQASETIDDLRKRLDASEAERREVSQHLRLLTDQTARPAPVAAPEQPSGFFRWFGRKSA